MIRPLLFTLALFAGAAHAAGPDGTLDLDFGTSGHVQDAFEDAAIVGGITPVAGDRAYLVGARTPSTFFTEILMTRFVASTGLPDPTFGSGTGSRSTDLPAGLRAPAVFAVTRQPDGLVLVAGTVDDGTAVRPAFVCRFFVAGTLDTGFAANGCRTIRTFLPGEEECRARGIAIDGSGRIVVAGYCVGAPPMARPFIARLTTTGAFDASLLGGVFAPIVLASGYSQEQYFQGVVVTPQGKIAVALTARHNQGDTDIGIAQYNDDGSPDASFAGGGHRVFAFDLGDSVPQRADHAEALVRRPDGRLVVIARSRFFELDGKITMAAVTATGIDDASFGTNGRRVDDAPLEKTFLAANDLVFHPLRAVVDRFGRILVSTYAASPSGDTDDVVRRYRPNGTPDPRFGAAGSVSIDHQIAVGGAQRTRDHAAGIALADGRVLVASKAQRPDDGVVSMVGYALADGDIFVDSFE